MCALVIMIDVCVGTHVGICCLCAYVHLRIIVCVCMWV